MKCLTEFIVPLRSQSEEELRSSYRGFGVNLFAPYSDCFGPDLSGSFEFDVFISYANVEPDAMRAGRIFLNCVQSNWRTFYAPASLKFENEHSHALPMRWAGLLEASLIASCHLICLLSPAHLQSAYCDLELQGFLRIASADRRRGLIIVPLDLDVDAVPQVLKPYLCEDSWPKIERRLADLIASSNFRLGRSRYWPDSLFDRLPISGEPDAWRFLPDADDDRKLWEFERSVREFMVLILKGAAPTVDSIVWPTASAINTEYKSEALAEAKRLVRDVSPYSFAELDSALGHGVGRDRAKLKGELPEELQFLEQVVERRSGPITYSPSGWYKLIDLGGRHFAQDMVWHCLSCGAEEEVGWNPHDAPPACPKCGYGGSR